MLYSQNQGKKLLGQGLKLMSPQDIENAKREGKKMSEHINKSQESLSDKKIVFDSVHKFVIDDDAMVYI